MTQGDRIKWQYTHFLNSKQSIQRVKEGIFIRLVKPRKEFAADWTANKFAIVKFDGNKTESKVLLSTIEFIKT